VRDWIVEVVRDLGAWGVGLLMLLENVFPPIPSELIMPLAGYLSASGDMSFTAALIAGSLGSFLGAVGWYVVGRKVSQDRFRDWVDRRGVWVAMTPDDVDRARDWFDRHGGASVLIARLVPGLRTVISVPAGFSRMSLVPFLLYTAVGTAAWTALLAWVGRLLGQQFPKVGEYVGIVAWVVIGGAVLWYVWRVVKLKRRGD